MRRIVFLYLLLLGGCSGAGKEPDIPVFNIDVEQEPVDIQQTGLFGDVRVVPLETTDSALIGRIDKAVLAGDRIYVADYWSGEPALFVYDTTGRFIGRCGRQGRGPGEFVQLWDFFVDSCGGRRVLNLLSRTPARLLRFDADGKEFLGAVELPFAFTGIAPLGCEGYVADAGNYSQGEEPCNLRVLGRGAELLAGGVRIDPGWESTVSSDVRPFSRYGDSLYYLAPREYALYGCDCEGISKAAHIDFGTCNWPTQLASYDAYRDYLREHPQPGFGTQVMRFQQTERHWMFVLLHRGQVRIALYDKARRTATICSPDGDRRKFVLPFGRIVALTEKHLVTAVAAARLKPFVEGRDEYNDYEAEYPRQVERLRAVVPGISEADNPCLVIYDLE